MGFLQLWLTAYPEDMDLNFDPVTGKRTGKKQEEAKIPLSRLLHVRDCNAILAGLVEREVRELTYKRPEQWFRYIDNRLSLACPDATQRPKLYEMKAARDCLEHNRGVINSDYLDKAGTEARYAESDRVQIDEPYLMDRFNLLRDVVLRCPPKQRRCLWLVRSRRDVAAVGEEILLAASICNRRD